MYLLMSVADTTLQFGNKPASKVIMCPLYRLDPESNMGALANAPEKACPVTTLCGLGICCCCAVAVTAAKCTADEAHLCAS